MTMDWRTRPRPYALRSIPDDFRRVFIEGGWTAVSDRYGARWTVVRRWIEESGGHALRAERRRFLTRHGPSVARTQAVTEG